MYDVLYNVRMFRHVYGFGEKFMRVVAVAFSALVFFTAFIFTAYNYELDDHVFDIQRDNIAVTLTGLLIFLLVGCALFLFVFRRNEKKRIAVFAIIVSAVTVLWGLYFVFFGRSMPNSDCWVVYSMSKSIASGDLSIINPTQSYMSYYPQQIGICTFLSWIIRFVDIFPFSIEEFHFIVIFYSFFEGITVWLLYKTVDTIWDNDRVSFVFLFLSLFNFPFIMYSEYVYGEIPALMFFSLGAFFLSCLFAGKGKPGLNIIFCVVAFGFSVFVRKNTLILIIGVLIALVFETFKTLRWRFFVAAVFIGTVSFLALPMTVKYYEKASGEILTEGVTPLSYFAMGMQEGPTGPGWYNGFNFDTFEQSGCDAKIADEISRQAIKERVAEFNENPGEALDFYKRKFLTQWVDGTYSSRESTWAYYGKRSGFLSKIYSEEYGKAYIMVCNIFQIAVFLGTLLWSLSELIKGTGDNLWKSFVFIGIFGGFLFHMFWEAGSRYILTYACLLIPYASDGYGTLLSHWRKHE